MKLPNNRQCGMDGDGKKVDQAPPFRNPFVHVLKFTPFEKAKIALMTVTLFPIRLLIAAFMMLLAWPFAFLATVGRSETAVEPQCLWRRLVDIILKIIMRVMWFAGGFHWVTVKGQRALPAEAPILTLAPHSSYFDAIPVTMTMASIVMKAESKDIPLWGTLIKYIRPVFVSRSDQDSRKKTVEEIKRRAHSGGEWPQIMIFPEGTCTNRSCLITFKPGAFIPAVPVQPVVIRYPNKLDTITWTWQGPGAFEILWLTLCQLYNEFVIEFLPVYTPSEEEKRNPALFAINVRRVMAKALGVPITDYSFEDCQLAMAEGQLRLPVDTCLLEYAKLVRRLGLKPKNTEKVLQEYGNRARKLEGQKLDLDDFAQFLDVPVSDMLRDVFALFDERDENYIDVREYVIALSVVCRPAKTLQTMKLAFKMFEAEEDGAITQMELAVILKTALGVTHLGVSRLFNAVDAGDTGKITFDKFRSFVDLNPDFAEDFLYTENPDLHSGTCHHHQAKTSLSSLNLKGIPKLSNGICPDFSPNYHVTADHKKHN
ncbi:lysophosphatidylcholine acyltransferase 1 [Takifugu flavidus]|uniref:Lysophosphatidylcholine acyltransferase 1 n=1 Tax=Takifugu flavidus TaxID=433684 RepID=A0A5C6PKI3_9TELE|nr:lysophosphatidylcholine acyltransferase 1 [Takifugu flavidus]TWW79481.1 Lysophosphatidylcholine acyltransferase 1 [Takifugu flavidus]